MVKDKLTQIIKFLMEGIEELSDSLEGTNRALTSFQKSILKVKKDLKRIQEVKIKTGTTAVEVEPQVSKPVAAGGARDKAASLLFNLLSTNKPSAAQPTASFAVPSATPSEPPVGSPKATSGPPSGPPKAPPAGPPKGLPKAAPATSRPPAPKMPPSGPPKAGPGKTLPPAPKMPPVPGAAPSATPGAVKSPTFATRPMAPPTPKGPPGAPPSMPSTSPTPAAAAAGAGGGAGLGGLREEMLKELERLKKIMRGS